MTTKRKNLWKCRYGKSDDMGFFKDDLKAVKAFVFDVDGVLSVAAENIAPNGELERTANVKDGYALMYSGKKGYLRAIISGGSGPGVVERYKRLGMEEVHMKIANKLEKLEELMSRYGLKEEEILYMGDDVPDYECMCRVGVPVCPADACQEIKAVARYISPFKGGEGCVRDVIEQTLKAQEVWMDTKCYVRSM